jgi:undecaprenyl phosphate-alpha-L-ara4N flippase subunit ArnE
MTLFQAGQLSAFALLLAAGQILFKRAAESGPPMRGLTEIIGLAGNPWVWAALTVYGGATIYWIYLLQQVPLTRAYPFAALSFVLVPGFAWLMFGDVVTLRYACGVALIVVGVYLSGFAES